MDVAREYPSGHIGSTPQNTEAIPAARIQGLRAELPVAPHRRVDAYLPLPPVTLAAQPGYLRDQSTVAKIDAADWLAQLAPNTVTPKTVGGPNLFGDA